MVSLHSSRTVTRAFRIPKCLTHRRAEDEHLMILGYHLSLSKSFKVDHKGSHSRQSTPIAVLTRQWVRQRFQALGTLHGLGEQRLLPSLQGDLLTPATAFPCSSPVPDKCWARIPNLGYIHFYINCLNQETSESLSQSGKWYFDKQTAEVLC